MEDVTQGLVLNKRDKTGAGMHSKIGRHATERFAILQRKADILAGKSKYFKASPISEFDVRENDRR